MLRLAQPFMVANRPLFDHISGHSSIHRSHISLHKRSSARINKAFYQAPAFSLSEETPDALRHSKHYPLALTDYLLYFFPCESPGSGPMHTVVWLGLLCVWFSPLQFQLAQHPAKWAVIHVSIWVVDNLLCHYLYYWLYILEKSFVKMVHVLCVHAFLWCCPQIIYVLTGRKFKIWYAAETRKKAHSRV